MESNSRNKGAMAFVVLTGSYTRKQLWNRGVVAFNASDRRILEETRAARGNQMIAECICCVQAVKKISLDNEISSIYFDFDPWMTTDGQPIFGAKPKLNVAEVEKMDIFEDWQNHPNFRTDEDTVVVYPEVWLLVVYPKNEIFEIIARSDPGQAMNMVDNALEKRKIAFMDELLALWGEDGEAFLLVLRKVAILVKFLENIVDVAEYDPSAAQRLFRLLMVGLLARRLSKEANEDRCGRELVENMGRSLLNLIVPLTKCFSIVEGSLETAEVFIKNIPLGLAQFTASLSLAVAESPPEGSLNVASFLKVANERFKEAVVKFKYLGVLPGKWNTAIMGLLLMEKLSDGCEMFMMEALVGSEKNHLVVFLTELDYMVLQYKERRTDWWEKFLVQLGRSRSERSSTTGHEGRFDGEDGNHQDSPSWDRRVTVQPAEIIQERWDQSGRTGNGDLTSINAHFRV